MSVNIVVPEMGESIVDARIGKWLKREGEAVTVGEPLVELETDKIDLEVSAPQSGVLAKIAHGDGDDVKIGEILGEISSGPSGPSGPAGPTGLSGSTGPVVSAASAAATVPATPSARRMAREENVPLASVKSSGPRVTKQDVATSKATGTPAAAAAPAVPATPTAAKSGRVGPDGPAGPVGPAGPAGPVGPAGPAGPVGPEERIRMSKRRATIAKRLVEVQQTAAMLTTFNEVDMTAVMSLRERQKQSFKDKHGVGLGIASFFVKAAVAALAEFPRLNAEIQGDEIVLKHYFDIGVAVGAAEGLVVPVLRGADRMTFAGIESAIRSFAAKVKDGTLSLDDIRGGTFTITNGGVFGSLMSTPILNPPQVGILGLHSIKDRPIGVNGQVVLRPMMYTALTYDHRIVDGSEAVRFLVRIKDLVEDPGTLLIES